MIRIGEACAFAKTFKFHIFAVGLGIRTSDDRYHQPHLISLLNQRGNHGHRRLLLAALSPRADQDPPTHTSIDISNIQETIPPPPSPPLNHLHHHYHHHSPNRPLPAPPRSRTAHTANTPLTILLHRQPRILRQPPRPTRPPTQPPSPTNNPRRRRPSSQMENHRRIPPHSRRPGETLPLQQSDPHPRPPQPHRPSHHAGRDQSSASALHASGEPSARAED